MADQLLGGIVINEILADPSGDANNFDTDGNGAADDVDEYIEFLNTSNTEIDISGVQIWDVGVGNYFTFPSGTTLQPGSYALVVTGLSGGNLPVAGPDDLAFEAGRGTAAINNGGDGIIVYDPSNDEFIAGQFNGASFVDPTSGVDGFNGFSPTASQIGSGEDFGKDTDGLAVQRAPDGSDTFVTGAPSPNSSNVCFANGTHFQGRETMVLVENLKAGDQLYTADHGLQAVKWVFSKTWSAAQIQQAPQLAPIVISMGALGKGYPSQDLRVSQQHRILVRGPIAERMFGTKEVLIAAIHLLKLDGVRIEQVKEPITYFHIMFEQHEIVFAEGLPVESLYLGGESLKTIPVEGLREIETLLGVKIADLLAQCPKSVRPFAEGKRAKSLIFRHMKNAKPLLVPLPDASANGLPFNDVI